MIWNNCVSVVLFLFPIQVFATFLICSLQQSGKQTVRSGIKLYWRHVNTCSQKLIEPERFKWYLLLDASQQYFVTCYPGFVFGMTFSNNIMLNCFCEQFLVCNNPFHNCKFHLSAKSSFVILYWRSKIMKSWQS